MRLKGILITVVVLLGILFAVTNWGAIMTTLPINLLFFTLQVPLGLALLSVAVALSVSFFVLSLFDRATQLRRTGQLERQLSALQAKLDRKRLEEIEGLETRLGERLMGLENKLGDESERSRLAQIERLEALGSQQLEQFGRLEERVLLVRNELAADIAEAEDALRRNPERSALEDR